MLYSGGPHLAIESKSSEDESNFRAEIEGDYYGIYLDHCSDSNITLNIMDLDSQTKGAGIAVFYSSRILIDENEVTNVNIPHIDFEQYEKGGIYLKSVMNSTVFKNTVDQTDKCNLVTSITQE